MISSNVQSVNSFPWFDRCKAKKDRTRRNTRNPFESSIVLEFIEKKMIKINPGGPWRRRLTGTVCPKPRHASSSKVSALSLTSKKRHGHKISMVTAYNYPSAIHVARAGIDVILVGDSLAMVELGHDTVRGIIHF
jgi:hypothetical protein